MSTIVKPACETPSGWDFFAANGWQESCTATWFYQDSSAFKWRSVPRYHHSLSRTTDHCLLDDYKKYDELTADPRKEADSHLLNADLVGIRGVEDVLKLYETNVGFYCDLSGTIQEHEKTSTKTIRGNVDGREIAASRERWAALVQELVCPPSREGSHLGNGTAYDFSRTETPSTPSDSVYFAESEYSGVSDLVPHTPKPNLSGAGATTADVPPAPLSFGYGKGSQSRLNASASSFVPTSSPSKSLRLKLSPTPSSRSPSPSFSNFSFPSLSSSLQTLPPTLHRDEQGFYTEISESTHASHSATPSPSHAAHRPSSALLPAFNSDNDYKPSKTRDLIERLRSGNVSRHSRSKSAGHSRSNSSSSQTCEHDSVSSADGRAQRSQSISDDHDENGWIHFPEAEAKARRTRELLVALARHRPESADEKVETECTDDKPPSEPSRDGWMGALSHVRPRKTPTHHARNGFANSAKSSSVGYIPPSSIPALLPPMPLVPVPPFSAAPAPSYIPIPYTPVHYPPLFVQGAWYPPAYPVMPVPLLPVPTAPIPSHRRAMTTGIIGGTFHMPW